MVWPFSDSISISVTHTLSYYKEKWKGRRKRKTKRPTEIHYLLPLLFFYLPKSKGLTVKVSLIVANNCPMSAAGGDKEEGADKERENLCTVQLDSFLQHFLTSSTHFIKKPPGTQFCWVAAKFNGSIVSAESTVGIRQSEVYGRPLSQQSPSHLLCCLGKARFDGKITRNILWTAKHEFIKGRRKKQIPLRAYEYAIRKKVQRRDTKSGQNTKQRLLRAQSAAARLHHYLHSDLGKTLCVVWAELLSVLRVVTPQNARSSLVQSCVKEPQLRPLVNLTNMTLSQTPLPRCTCFLSFWFQITAFYSMELIFGLEMPCIHLMTFPQYFSPALSPLRFFPACHPEYWEFFEHLKNTETFENAARPV